MSIPAKLVNPCRFEIQRLALQLKCRICLNLLNKPMLLPCDHIFCNACILASGQFESECQLCERHYNSQDIRPAPYMENVVTVYRSLDAAFTTNLLPGSNSDNLQGLRGQEKDNLEGKRQCLSGQSIGSELCTEERDVIQVIQASPTTSPDSNNSIGKHTGKALVDANQAGCKSKERSHSGKESSRNLKRQKRTDNRLFDGRGTSNEITQSNGSCSGRVASSKSKLKSGERYGDDAPKDLDPFGMDNNICAFCQSSKITDGTGLMLHFVNEREVAEEEAMNSEAIHVHTACINWTPQTYFRNERAMNLESEIARAAKLKCSHCGIKGAALGCSVKKCQRTYHLPCALEIPDCRWDQDAFLLLCPVHSKAKFPGEKLKPGEHARRKQHSVPEAITSSSVEVSPNEPKPLLFCEADLSTEEKFELVEFANKRGILVTKFWNPNVTHVIASTDSNGAYSRTEKVLKGILYGRWIVKTDWVKASIEAKQFVNEEPYELCQDTNGCRYGPKIGRLRATMKNPPKLFNGLNFYFVGDFENKDELFDLVITAGGTIIQSKQDLVSQNHVSQTTLSTTLVVYNSGVMTGEMMSNEVVSERKSIEAAKSIGNELGLNVVKHTWVIDSISLCEVMPF